MHRPATSLALALVAAALLAAGCGESSPSAEPQPPPSPSPAPSPTPPPPPAPPSPSFKKADLPRIALGPKNAPSGLVYVEDESGPMTLEDAGLVLPQQTRPLQGLGFEAMHDAIFVAKRQRNDQRVSQRIWLFRNRGGAAAWLRKTQDDASSLQFTEVTAPPLGDSSWAAQGLIQVGGGQAITHAFQLGNTVHTVSMYGEVTPPTEAGALAAAQAALAKARK
jgi:hypothetical protein